MCPGFYDVFAAAPAFTPACRKARVKSGGKVTIRFRLAPDPLYGAEMGTRIKVARPKL